MTMKVLVLVLSLGAVFARPDVSHLSNAGYHYKPPTNSYGVPIDNGHGESAHQHHHQIPSGSYLPASLQVPLTDSHVNFLGGSTSSKHEDYAFNSQLIQDQKHVYYYAAPDEEEHTHLRIHIAPNNQKNTNVIFVKAPSVGHIVPEVIAPPSQGEDKTKVFVLVKKPDQPAPISIQAPTPVKTKPEVYVVKYDNQHEAEQAISGGRGGHPLGANVHQVGDEKTFLKVLEGDSSHHVPHNDKYSGFDGNIDAFAGKTTLYGAPAIGGSNSGASLSLRGSFGSDDSSAGSSLLDSTSSGSHGSGSVDFSSVQSDSGKGSSFDLGSSGSLGGSSNSGSSYEVRGNFGSEKTIEGSSLLGSSGSSGSSGSAEFSVSGISSGNGEGSGSHVGSSLDTLKLGGDSEKTVISLSSSGSGSDHSSGSGSSDSFGVRGNFVGAEGSSVSSSFPSSDSSKSGSFTSTFEISGGSKDAKEFSSPLLSSLTGASHGSGSSSSSFEYSSSKSGDSGTGSLGARLGDIGDGSSSSASLVKSVHSTYGPPGLSGPY